MRSSAARKVGQQHHDASMPPPPNGTAGGSLGGPISGRVLSMKENEPVMIAQQKSGGIRRCDVHKPENHARFVGNRLPVRSSKVH